MTDAELLEILRNRVRFDGKTGQFIWVNNLTHPRKNGKPIGHVNRAGRHEAWLGNRKFHDVSHLVWFYVKGEWPSGVIDHINGDPLDNRIANLRDVGAQINAQNLRRPSKNNKTGFLGVSYSKVAKRFTAFITLNGKRKCLGYFDTPEEAHAKYIDVKRLFHTGNTL